MFSVVPIAEEHIEGFRAALDSVARERRYLTFLEGVLAEFRGHGIGTALIRETLKKARSAAFTRIELGVRERNGRVVGLYERFGFVHEGVQRNAIRLDGEYENLICMALLLD